MKAGVNDANINEYGRFDALKGSVDKAKAKKYLEAISGKKILPHMINTKVDELLRKFILSGGYDIPMPE